MAKAGLLPPSPKFQHKIGLVDLTDSNTWTLKVTDGGTHCLIPDSTKMVPALDYPPATVHAESLMIGEPGAETGL